jgi:tetratricopeptide (TPR) repeat protein
MGNLAAAYDAAAKPEKALPLYEDCFRRSSAALGPDHPGTLIAMSNLAAAYHEAEKPDKAIPLMEECLRLRTAKLGPDHADTLASMSNLAVAYDEAGKTDKALPLYEECFRLRTATLGPEHQDTLTSMSNLGTTYAETGHGEKAASTLSAYIEAQRKRLPKEDVRFAVELAEVSLPLLRCNQFTTAEGMLRECYTLRAKKEPRSWSTFNAQSMLGGALLGQKKYADAEPLLVKGYEGLKAREKAIPKEGATRIPEALDRLVVLYTALEKPDEVKKYQELRAKYPAAKKDEKK